MSCLTFPHADIRMGIVKLCLFDFDGEDVLDQFETVNKTRKTVL